MIEALLVIETLALAVIMAVYLLGGKQTTPLTTNNELDLTPEDAKFLLDRNPCNFCGGYHDGQCARVRKVTYVGGEVSEVEYWQHWDDSNVIWPREVHDALERERVS